MLPIRPTFSSSRKNFEDKQILGAIEKIFIDKRGAAFRMPREGEPVILILSGGLDSISLWHMLMAKHKFHVYPLYISLGNTYDPQERSIRYFSTYFRKKYPKFFHPIEKVFDHPIVSMYNLITSKILDFDISFVIPNLVYNSELKRYTVHFVNSPSRQARFAFDAYEYAHILRYKHNVDVHTIFCAMTRDDIALMRESTLTVLRSINLAMCLIIGDFRWQFTGTLEKKAGFFYSRNDLVSFALEKKLPLEKTWSCYKRYIFHCGTCPSCIQRKNTFETMGIPDKTRYLPFAKQIRDFLKRRQRVSTNVAKVQHSPISNKLDGKFISPAPDIEVQTIDGKVYLWNKKEKILESINDTASYIFELINRKKAVKIDSLVHLMQKRYKIGKNQLRTDVASYVKKAVQKGYLVLK